MTKSVTPRQMKDAFLNAIQEQFGVPLRCQICRKPMLPGQKIGMDHRHADATGGAHHYLNIRPVHAEMSGEFNCHIRKTSHPRGKHTSIDSDTHTAAKLDRTEKFVVHKPPLGEPKAEKPKRKWAPHKFVRNTA